MTTKIPIRLTFCLLFLSVFIYTSCKRTEKDKAIPTSKVTSSDFKAMVVSAREEVSEIGVDIMKKGGNAFDAMIATEMALAVAYPFAGNLGGGGFMVYRLNDGTVGSLDYREKAPLAAHKDMYLDSLGEPIAGKSREGALAVGVPGTVAGIFEVHKKFGTLPIAEILEPVIQLAKKGVVITTKQQARLARFQEDFIRINKDTILFAKQYQIGDTLKNSLLAKTLQRIAQHGKDEFYTGTTAKKLVSYLNQRGGIITLQDLAEYEAVWRDPVQFSYKDLDIISMGPPSSGGVTLGQIMKMIEPYPFNKSEAYDLKTLQVIIEAERRAYADRNHYLGDPDFVTIPIDTLLNGNYLKKRMKNFSFSAATSSSEISKGTITGYESDETTHYSIVDALGNAVSVTTTLNGAYGSKLYASELGFFLNNEMDDFSAKPGSPNMFGLTGSVANEIAPGKRMLSSMTPTIVTKDDKLWMVVGTPGGSTIITSVLQTILNVYEYNMTMQEAVTRPRFHHQWLPDKVVFEPNGFSKKLLDSLASKGYSIDQSDNRIIGKVDAILVDKNGFLKGGADPRGDDTVVGF
ncbi:gamma-glutamyltransferase [Aquimarina sp. ERC-38]|uniref:gamma-glutamyltransferase n=1 Tax=Aquimarina sp. ERC-38 TaxID=2949996 RepID=UPI0022466D03|nr:gamma-glutamyltransferase [Aquimarina sp. ERC-38]UZO79859.1 gamma-glutamyltransferase [Aquimarina sp. ERC-38]